MRAGISIVAGAKTSAGCCTETFVIKQGPVFGLHFSHVDVWCTLHWSEEIATPATTSPVHAQTEVTLGVWPRMIATRLMRSQSLRSTCFCSHYIAKLAGFIPGRPPRVILISLAPAVIEAYARTSSSRRPSRVASERAPNEASNWIWIYCTIWFSISQRRRHRSGRLSARGYFVLAASAAI